MPHFFINEKDVNNNLAKISEKENFNHIVKSLRMTIGENILLIDEKQMQYEGIICEINKDSLIVEIKDKYPSKRYLDFDLSLAQSPLRSEKQLLIIEKATELGVNTIYPVLTDNCALKKTVIEQKISKWQKVMAESSKQCERAFIPKCEELSTLEKLLENENFDRILAFTEREAKMSVKEYLLKSPINKNEKILAIIGPEGGFSQKEFDFFKTKKNIMTLSLGDLILRAETAVIVALGSIAL